MTGKKKILGKEPASYLLRIRGHGIWKYFYPHFDVKFVNKNGIIEHLEEF